MTSLKFEVLKAKIALASISKLRFKARGESTDLGNESKKELWSSVSKMGRHSLLKFVAVTVVYATSQCVNLFLDLRSVM